jgi:putative aminopeptidase FrvX
MHLTQKRVQVWKSRRTSESFRTRQPCYYAREMKVEKRKFDHALTKMLRAKPEPRTVQAEIGLRGAHTAAEVVKPDVGIALEAGVTRDVPGVKPDEAQEVLGGGPGIFLFNMSQLPNRKFVP